METSSCISSGQAQSRESRSDVSTFCLDIRGRTLDAHAHAALTEASSSAAHSARLLAASMARVRAKAEAAECPCSSRCIRAPVVPRNTVIFASRHRTAVSRDRVCLRRRRRREREGEGERAFLGTIHNGGSRASPAHALRSPRYGLLPHTPLME